MSKDKEYTYVSYGVGRVFLPEGPYTREDLLKAIAWIDELNSAAKKSIKEIE